MKNTIKKLNDINFGIQQNDRYTALAKTKLEEAILWLDKAYKISENSEKYTEKDLVSFGNYLLSDLRIVGYRKRSEENLEERLSAVTDADIYNWYNVKDKV